MIEKKDVFLVVDIVYSWTVLIKYAGTISLCSEMHKQPLANIILSAREVIWKKLEFGEISLLYLKSYFCMSLFVCEFVSRAITCTLSVKGQDPDIEIQRTISYL